MTVAFPREDWEADGSPRISLLDIDDRFMAAVPAHEQPAARRALTTTAQHLAAGPWRPPAPAGSRAPFGVLIVDGAILQEVSINGRQHAQLLGTGDILRPWSQAETVLPCSMTWTVLSQATVALLGQGFRVAARYWPALTSALHDHLCDQLDRAARHACGCSLARVEDRTIALFLQLADRWGAVTAEGIAVRLSLTHEQIGRMIGAKRPTVSLALTALADAGLLRRDDGGTWLLSRSAAQRLMTAGSE